MVATILYSFVAAVADNVQTALAWTLAWTLRFRFRGIGKAVRKSSVINLQSFFHEAVMFAAYSFHVFRLWEMVSTAIVGSKARMQRTFQFYFVRLALKGDRSSESIL